MLGLRLFGEAMISLQKELNQKAKFVGMVAYISKSTDRWMLLLVEKYSFRPN